MKPPGNAQTIISYGNATSPFVGSMAAIDHRVGNGSPSLGAPNLTGNAPRLPLIERLTPRSVNASRVASQATATARERFVSINRQAVNFARGFVNSAAMRQRARSAYKVLPSGIRWG